jgi:hypothetical protein
LNHLRKAELAPEDDLVKFQKLREKVDEVGDLITVFSKRLPIDKNNVFPDLYEFLRM